MGQHCFYELGSVQNLADHLPRAPWRYNNYNIEFPLCFCGVLLKPWSEAIGAFNLLDYCLKESRRRMEGGKLRRAWNSLFDFVVEKFGLKDLIDQLRYKSQNTLDSKLWDYIFDELHDKAFLIDHPGKAKEISEAKGGFALRKSHMEELMHYVTDYECDEEKLVWHVATEICYHIGEDGNDHKRLCKVLSDYMLYLLVMQQEMTSAIADIGQIRFHDSCSEASALWKIFRTKDVKELCVKILEEKTSHEPAHEAKKSSKSVLQDACKLAKILLLLNDKKWEITSSIWVEILSYAANHCRPDNHARMVCEVGELISFVWLLMAHLGIGTRFPKRRDL